MELIFGVFIVLVTIDLASTLYHSFRLARENKELGEKLRRSEADRQESQWALADLEARVRWAVSTEPEYPIGDEE